MMHFRVKSIHLTMLVSMTLVLYLVGLVLTSGIYLFALKKKFKEQIHLNIYFRPTTPPAQIFRWESQLEGTSGVRDVRYYSADDALRFMEQEVGADIDSVLGVNPFPPMLDVYFNADFVTAQRIDSLVNLLSASPYVRDVTYQRDLVKKLNYYLRMIFLVFGSLALLFFFISWILVHNAIRITLYSDRFLIRTMELVGATPFFIIRPYVLQTAIIGLVAGFLADALIVGTVHLAIQQLPFLIEAFSGRLIYFVLTGILLPLWGAFFAGLSSYFSVRHFLKMKLEELY